ncbi:zinc finger protein constans-like 3 [Phtheirospermum japonicum]|uniref:Zinc finger protein constans-like 3 n=1 Tax=Phtheirospermum japonicum TaxID=374723 RepID=A0A830BVD3_9LAMI|nr:zinc finger protein constans-like 3 [Phtheirospermum japonicum]
MNYDIYSPVSVASFPQDHHHHQQQFGLVNSDSSVSEIESGFSNFAVNCHYQNDHQVFEPGDECFNGLLPNFYNNLMAAENWKLKGNNQVITNVEETEVKVGRYSAEERKDRILRYLKKRNQRNFNKTIKYACRKTLADKRVRVRGRFAKNNEPACEDTNPHNMTSYEPNSLSNFVDSIQVISYYRNVTCTINSEWIKRSHVLNSTALVSV